MDIVHAVASLVLGAVFVGSGVAKLIDVAGWRRQAAGLAVPGPVAVAVPVVELAVGAATATQLAAPAPAAAALGLLVAFTALIGWNLRHGRRPPCACFGAASTTPISWRHIARNAILVVIAVIAVATATP